MLRDESIAYSYQNRRHERRKAIDGAVLTFQAPSPLGNELPGNVMSLQFGNLSDNAGI